MKNSSGKPTQMDFSCGRSPSLRIFSKRWTNIQTLMPAAAPLKIQPKPVTPRSVPKTGGTRSRIESGAFLQACSATVALVAHRRLDSRRQSLYLAALQPTSMCWHKNKSPQNLLWWRKAPLPSSSHVCDVESVYERKRRYNRAGNSNERRMASIMSLFPGFKTGDRPCTPLK